jgi:hypothetical protein
MARSPILIVACALALVACSSARAQDSQPSSPSLGDLARQAQKDKDKDKANKTAAKVLTNDDLPSGSSGDPSALGPGFDQLSMQPQPAGSKTGANPLPAEKLANLEAFIAQVESMDRATLVRSVMKGNDADFPGRAKWEDRLVAAKETYVVQFRELIQKAKQIVADSDSLKGTQDPNDPRVKEMGARLQNLIRDAVQTNAALQAVVIEGRDLAAQPAAH